LQTAFYSGEKA